jgi:hypothetical protein
LDAKPSRLPVWRLAEGRSKALSPGAAGWPSRLQPDGALRRNVSTLSQRQRLPFSQSKNVRDGVSNPVPHGGTVEIIRGMIDLARDIRAARTRGEEEGLSPDEIAFYDALAENRSAVEAMGHDQLKVIARELFWSRSASTKTTSPPWRSSMSR